MTMGKVYHPTFGTVREVPAGDVAAWKAAGWRTTPPRTRKAPTPPPTAPDDTGDAPPSEA